MSSTRMPDNHLRLQFLNRVSRLLDFLAGDNPASIMAYELALVLATGKLLYGEELVESRVQEIWQKTRAREEGRCVECLVNPAVEDQEDCRECFEKGKREAARVEYDFLDLKNTKPQ